MLRLIVCFLATSLAYAQVPIRGFSPEEAQQQRQWEEKFKAIPEPGRIRAYLERMSQKPHHAGSAGSKAVAEYTAGLLREWGLDTSIEEFEALLPYPTVRKLEVIKPVPYTAQLKEPAMAEDANSSDTGQLPTYNAYSASGDVTAPVVYANYGLPEDYDLLARLGVDVRGKIVLTRYGKSWRGVKPKVAYEHGAVACLIYSDPREDGYFAGDVYPAGAYRPEQGVQRGSVMDMAVYAGDPLSPGWASEKGSRRLSREEAKVLMKIPVMPISYGDALPILKQLTGPVPPESWRGALPVTYHVGPGAMVHLQLDFDWSTKPLYDVIATIPGSDLPDEWILYGNHHDAWVNGANDPLSGAASLLETARSLAALRKQGWKPRRTIKLALWDGEEFGLVGSTEWVEKHRQELQRKAIAYFNSDSNGKGPIGASGSPVLEQFLVEVLRDVKDPESDKSVLDASRPRGRMAESPNRSRSIRLSPLGAGSDYVAFAHFAGIASLNLGFGGDSGGIYHSIYDTFSWYTRFSDGTFVYGKALSQVMGTAMMRLANASILPFEFSRVASAVKSYVDDIQREANLRGEKLEMDMISAELLRLQQSAEAYERQYTAAIGRVSSRSTSRLSHLNETLFRSERALLQEQGLPGREWFKSQISAPGLYTGYGAKTLPGVREAVEAGRFGEARAQSKVVADTLRQFRQQVDQAAKQLTESGI